MMACGESTDALCRTISPALVQASVGQTDHACRELARLQGRCVDEERIVLGLPGLTRHCASRKKLPLRQVAVGGVV